MTKSDDEVDEMRDRLARLHAAIVHDDQDGHMKQKGNISAAEAALDWARGEMPGYEGFIENLESKYNAESVPNPITCPQCGHETRLFVDGDFVFYCDECDEQVGRN